MSELVHVPNQQTDYTPPPELVAMPKLKPGQLTIVQPTTLDPKGARIGQLLDTVTGRFYDEMKVVLFAYRKGRVFYKDKESFGQPPLCRSVDLIVPAPNALAPQSSTCKICPRSQWKINPETGKKIPPPCGERYNILLFNKTTEIPYYFSVGGNSIRPFEGLVQILGQDRQENLKTKKLVLYDHDYFFTIYGESMPGKAFKILGVKDFNRLPDDHNFRRLYHEYIVVPRQERLLAAAESQSQQAVDDVVDAEFTEI